MAFKNTAVTVLLTLLVYYFQASRSLPGAQIETRGLHDDDDDDQTEINEGQQSEAEDIGIDTDSDPDSDPDTDTDGAAAGGGGKKDYNADSDDEVIIPERESSDRVVVDRTVDAKDELYKESKRKLEELLSDDTAKDTVEYAAGKLKEIFSNHVSSSSLINISAGVKDILFDETSQHEILVNLRQFNKELRKPETPAEIRQQYAKLKTYLESEESARQIGEMFDALADVITSDGIEETLTEAGNSLITLVKGDDAPRRIRLIFRDLDALMRSNPDEVLKNAAKNTLSSANRFAGRFARKLTGRGANKKKSRRY